ncbi:hypothetical protein BAC2_01339 [uncultured bacterium]|nr:hypothetical protein BAC2_01339 [uncultured bacterium]
MILAVHPVLMARDVPTSIAFFLRLGFTLVFTDSSASPRYAVLTRDACELHLQWQDESQWQGHPDRPTYRFLVADVDRFFHELLSSGIVSDPSASGSPWALPGNTPWGTREFHLKDPGGNGLQFYRPV